MIKPAQFSRQSIQNMQSEVRNDLVNAKSASLNRKKMDEKAAEIYSLCNQILSLLSTHDGCQNDSWTPAEKLRLEILNNKLKASHEFFKTLSNK